ncbi:MAG: superoxide dismutase [Bacteroidales bacterium]
MKFELPQLPYSLDSLAPAITKETMDYHYGKHLQTYMDNLNTLIVNTPFEKQTLETIVETADGPIYNNAAQTYNHIFYFFTLSPIGGGEPQGYLREAIDKKWGSFEAFKKEFSNQAVSIFGSGWMWLQCDITGKLSISREHNAGCPITKALTPLMTIDVWEHAYYLSHQNRRAEYVKAIWDIIDWRKIEAKYR